MRLKFIDIFAGLGGFHVGLRKLGYECVFASEIDPDLRELYHSNFGILPEGDIRKVDVSDIPTHDILCAGFPCQPFSKAGSQLGLECPNWGDLFSYIVKILEAKQPNYFILENVPNLLRHDTGKTWKKMEKQLAEAGMGYLVKTKELSPHQFGIPQIRNRLIIVGSRRRFHKVPFPQIQQDAEPSIHSVLDKNPAGAQKLSEQVINCLNVWQDFLDAYPVNIQLPSFPIWSMEFGATYPHKGTTPHAMGIERLRRWRGNHGIPLKKLSDEMILENMPSYAWKEGSKFPKWKIKFIEQNRQLYKENKTWIDHWRPKILEFPQSLQKFEWNCKGEARNVWNFVIQFRASGVRLKRPTTAPSLVAMTTTQVPIIGWERRYMTTRECARLQGLDELENFPLASTKSFKALGNAVNADLVRLVVQQLVMSTKKPIAFSIPETSLVATNGSVNGHKINTVETNSVLTYDVFEATDC